MEASPRDVFLKDKSHLKSDLAIIIAHKKRNKAIEYLIEAKTINEQLRLKKNVRFIDVQIQRIKKSKMINKLQEYTCREMANQIYGRASRSTKTKPIKASKTEAAQYKKLKEE